MDRTVYISILLVTIGLVFADNAHDHDNRRPHVYSKDHIKDDLHNIMPEEEFELESDEAMEFHYFKLHDFNNDNKLDGLELGAAMTHYHDGGSEGEGRRKQIDISDDELEMLINQILKDDDLNDDGYVDYYEFVKAQRRAEVGV